MDITCFQRVEKTKLDSAFNALSKCLENVLNTSKKILIFLKPYVIKPIYKSRKAKEFKIAFCFYYSLKKRIRLSITSDDF